MRQRYVIEIQGARDGHAIVRCQDHFGGQSPDGRCSRGDDDFVEAVNHAISGEYENWAALIGEAEGIPADLSALQATFSQSSPSQARGSTSAENSVGVGGIAR